MIRGTLRGDMTSSRFQVGVHALVVLAVWSRPTSSEAISYSIDTNPAVIRRIVGDLREAGLVESRRGPGGGFVLARPAREISLLDVYRAVDAGPVFAPYDEYPVEECPVGSRVPDVLDAALAPAVDALERWLETRTIADLTEEIARDAEAELGEPLLDALSEIRAELDRRARTDD
jgi:Rrf2 family protein